MKVSPKRLESYLTKYRVPYKRVPGWDSAKIDPYNGRSDFEGIVLHHTAGSDSLRYIVSGNPYAPVRACHFLVDRDGTVQLVSGVGAYHAGAGGPWKITRTTTIPKDAGNSRTYGIEIESLGTSPNIDGTLAGMTVQQVVSTALLCAALLDAMSPVPGVPYKVGRVIRHRDWANGRKFDTRQTLDWWQEAVRIARQNRAKPDLARKLVRDFVKAHPRGSL